MKRVPNYVIPLAFSALAAIQSTSYAAVDMFLKLEDIKGELIKGESLDEAHKDEIDVLAWSWDLSQSSDPRIPIVRPISFTKYIDLSSPVLYDHLLTNRMAGKATLTVRKSGVDPLEYVIITMSDVTVTTVSTGGSGGEDRLTETVSLNFSSACVQYTPQDDTGNPGATIETCWTFDKGAQ